MEPKKLRTQHQSEQEHEHQNELHSARQQNVREFESVEDLLRHDAAQVPAPETLAPRLKDSTAKEPPAPPGFWQRLFGR